MATKISNSQIAPQYLTSEQIASTYVTPAQVESNYLPLSGGTMTGNITGAWIDKLQNLGTLTKSTNINCSNGNYAIFTVGSTITLNLTANATCRMITLQFSYASDSYTLYWGSSIHWDGGSAPEFDTTTGAINIVTLTTCDSGSNWYAVQSFCSSD